MTVAEKNLAGLQGGHRKSLGEEEEIEESDFNQQKQEIKLKV